MIIDVRIWDQFIGALTWDENRKVAVFKYTPDFVKNGPEIAPLLMPLRENYSYEFNPYDYNYNTFKALPPTVADSLPDDFGNYIMRAWLGKQGKTIDNLTPLERLSYVGKRGMGALEYEPVLDGKDFKPTLIFLNLLKSLIK